MRLRTIGSRDPTEEPCPRFHVKRSVHGCVTEVVRQDHACRAGQTLTRCRGTSEVSRETLSASDHRVKRDHDGSTGAPGSSLRAPAGFRLAIGAPARPRRRRNEPRSRRSAIQRAAVDVHVADSLAALSLAVVRSATRIADVGCRRGLPGAGAGHRVASSAGLARRERDAQGTLPCPRDRRARARQHGGRRRPRRVVVGRPRAARPRHSSRRRPTPGAP